MKQERYAQLLTIIDGLGQLLELKPIYEEALGLEAEIRTLTATRDARRAEADDARTQAAAERARAELARRDANPVVAENQRRMRESAEAFAAQETAQADAQRQRETREAEEHEQAVLIRREELATLDAEIAAKTRVRDALTADLAALRARFG